MQGQLFQAAFASCERDLRQRGIKLSVVNDFTMVADIALELGYQYLTPNLSPHHNTCTRGNCFWLTASDDQGLTGACAVRCNDIEDEPLGDFWRRCNHYYYRDYIPSPTLKINSALSEGLFGRLCYWGALKHVTREGAGKNLGLMCKAAQMLAAKKWMPDFTYAFIQDFRAEHGAAMKYGFCSVMPNSHQWVNPPPGRNTEELCVYSSLDDLQLVAESIVGDENSLE